MTEAQLLGRWGLFHRWRWLGITLFCLAIPFPVLALTHIVVREGEWKLLLFSIGSLALSLGSFGTANDTAVHALRELDNQNRPVPNPAELAIEQERRAERLGKIHDSPKAAFVMPALAGGLIGWQALFYLRAWGVLA